MAADSRISHACARESGRQRLSGVALLLALVSGFLFGAVPVRQVLRTDPYEVVKAGSTGIIAGNSGRRITLRDVLLVVQIAICAVLVTSSLVAVRGLHALACTAISALSRTTRCWCIPTLHMAGYSGDTSARHAKAHDRRRCRAIPGVESVGFDRRKSRSAEADRPRMSLPTRRRICGRRMPPPTSILYHVSPEYFHAAGTIVLAGRSFTWHDDKNSPRVAVVNREFAARSSARSANAVGRYYKIGGWNARPGGGRCRRRKILAAHRRSAAGDVSSVPAIASRARHGWWCARSAIRSNWRQRSGEALRELDPGLPVIIQTWTRAWIISPVSFAHGDGGAGCAGLMGAMLSITGIFGMAAYSVSKRLRELGIRVALGAQRKEVLQAALGRAIQIAGDWLGGRIAPGNSGGRVLAFIVYQATPRDPLVLAGVVLAMAACWACGHVDSGAARAVGGSDDAAARGVNRTCCKTGYRMWLTSVNPHSR